MVTEVDHVFFTHHHSDHDSDYPCLLLTRFDLHTGKENPLNVYGPPPTERLTDQLMGEGRGAFWHDVVARTNHPMSLGAYRGRGGVGERKPPVIHARDLASGDVVNGNGWQVRAAEVAHAQPYLDSLGYRVDTDEGSVAFSGDTSPCKAMTELARGVDLLVMECVRREPDMSEGSLIAETGSRGAAQTAVDAGAKKMVLVHQNELIDEPVARSEVIAEVKGIYRRTGHLGRRDAGNRGLRRLPVPVTLPRAHIRLPTERSGTTGSTFLGSHGAALSAPQTSTDRRWMSSRL